jgi:hypothetical protein
MENQDVHGELGLVLSRESFSPVRRRAEKEGTSVLIFENSLNVLVPCPNHPSTSTLNSVSGSSRCDSAEIGCCAGKLWGGAASVDP